MICIKSHSKHGTGFYENIVDEFKLQKDLKNKLTLTFENGRIEKRRYYLFSKNFSEDEFEKYQMSHWQIEAFHSVLDNSFNEDHMRMKKGSSTLNTNLLRKLVNFIKSHTRLCLFID